MGYTHYWRGTPNLTAEVVADIWSIIKASGVKIGNGLGQGTPELKLGGVRFNGSEADGEDYETFALSDSTSFDFCKTARRPYDVVVCAALIRVREASPKFTVTSDGLWDDDGDGWVAARALYADALGRETILIGLDN